MVLSGLVMIQVRAPHGDFLVCLDLRKGTRYDVISLRNRGDDQEYVVSDTISTTGFQQGTSHLRIPLNVSDRIAWGRTAGIYGNLNSSFT
jgi:hypothetical protein